MIRYDRSEENFNRYGKGLEECRNNLYKFIDEHFTNITGSNAKEITKAKNYMDNQIKKFQNCYEKYLEKQYNVAELPSTKYSYIKCNTVEDYIKYGEELHKIERSIRKLYRENSPLKNSEDENLHKLINKVISLKFIFEDMYLDDFPKGELLWGRLIRYDR